MRRFFTGLFVVIGIVAVVGFLALVGVAAVALRVADKAKQLPEAIVLTADLSAGLSDGADASPLSRLLFDENTTLRDFVDALGRAADDPRVGSLVVELGDDSMALAKVQQVRDSIAAFRAKGKFALAYADTFGEGGPGTRPYYLATACDEIWLQPLGEVGLTGLRSETPFLRGALDKIGITPDFEHREEYKTAMNSLTESAMTAPQREEVEGLLVSLSAQIDRDIAEARHATPDQIAGLTDRAPLLQDEAREAKLIDRLGYRDEARRRARDKAGPDAKFVSLSRYLERAGRPHASGSKIALVFGTGLITRNGAGGIASDTDFTARAMAKALDAAGRDSDVRAIVVRIDSPGGSATASETVWREVGRARERGKPVVVSMGDVAASGGYYIAAAADKIVAEPATLTGSIGVLAGKVVIGGLMEKLGVRVDSVQRGANAGMYAVTEDFSPQAKARLNASLDSVYAGFKAHVAQGRRLDPDAVEAVAKGRVWTGADAKEKGLVDALGGYETAFALARQAAHLAPDAPIEVVVFPKERGLAATLLARLTGGDSDDDRVASSRLMRGVDAVDSLVSAARTVLDPAVLRMPAVGDIR
ncbi:MAG: signal peptide peptidase SppA [Alphaproteobacteria bacterium]|nr:signal peptide peptidase SppA [Alphaproteobacteria bacterium]